MTNLISRRAPPAGWISSRFLRIQSISGLVNFTPLKSSRFLKTPRISSLSHILKNRRRLRNELGCVPTLPSPPTQACTLVYWKGKLIGGERLPPSPPLALSALTTLSHHTLSLSLSVQVCASNPSSRVQPTNILGRHTRQHSHLEEVHKSPRLT